MSYWVLALEFVALSIVVFLILRELISFKRTVWYAVVSTWIGWLLCFAIVFLLPLDILNTDHQKCREAFKDDNPDLHCPEPWSYVPQGAMEVQWRLLYWGTFLLSWAVFPILQTYWLAGDFTLGERLLRSIKENLVLYAILGVIGVFAVLGLLIFSTLKPEKLVGVIMTIANAYGLVLVVLLMGYGLVDIPRLFFKMGSRDRMMQHYYLQTVIQHEGLEKAQADLTKVLKQVKKVSDKVREMDPYRPYVDKIVGKCPLEYDSIEQGDGDTELTYAKLAALHAKVKDTVHAAQRAAILYEMHIKHAHEHEDIIASYGAADSSIHWTFRPPRSSKHALLINKLEYIWLVYLYPWAFRILALVTALMSLMIIWCELTMIKASKDISDPGLSPFAHIIQSSRMQGLGKQIFCFLPLLYMTICAYTSLFKLRIFNYYRLVRHHMSDANSIMFSANYLSRLAAPLAFNYLQGIIHQDDGAFTAVMGDMDATSNSSEVGPMFRKIFPILVVVVCLMAVFKVFSRIAACCCIKSFQITVDESPVAVERGRQILQESRNAKTGGGKVNSKSIKQAVLAQFSGVKNTLRSIRTTTQVSSDEDGGDTGASLNDTRGPSQSGRPSFDKPTANKAPMRPVDSSGYSNRYEAPSVDRSSDRPASGSSSSAPASSSSSATSGARGAFSSLFGSKNKGGEGAVELLPRNGPRSDK
eukprot:TRINITY_DN5927_c0_g1_i1.p1 TRINITY_DN5927_c0_g1~~TRINITY_DN5927_c0_g1_i1.p1  ORF type:complete len:699 (-),score=120.24 TRINITY_DN5927_c0_g1_i1:69-2165(-)